MLTPVSRRLVVQGIGSPCVECAPDAPGLAAEEAVVFIHGNPGSSEDWRALVGHVGRFARALAVDMPGFGQADKPDDFDYTVAGYARHLESLLAALGVTRVHLVLHDFGGAWGLAWAARNPARVASVSLFNIGILPGYRWHFMARLWRTPLLGELVQASTTEFGFRQLLKIGNPRGLPSDFVARMYRDYDKGTRRAVLRLYRATGPEEVERFSADVLAALRPHQIPAVVIWGQRDIFIPSRYAEVQREVFPDLRTVMLADSGHWAFADNPSACADALGGFLRRQFLSTTP